jgi:hypothetical protein
MREGIERALALTGAASARALRRSPVARQIDGWAVADLEALGSVPPRHRILRKIDPRPGARELRAAWRVGRLARALPAIGRDVVAQVDGDLLDVPRLDDLSNRALLAVLDNGRTALRALHGYEALSGMLVPEATTVVTAASIAMSALAEARAEGVEIDDLTRQNPVVLGADGAAGGRRRRALDHRSAFHGGDGRCLPPGHRPSRRPRLRGGRSGACRPGGRPRRRRRGPRGPAAAGPVGAGTDRPGGVRSGAGWSRSACCPDRTPSGS